MDFKKKQKNNRSTNVVFLSFAAIILLVVVSFLIFKNIEVYKKKQKLNYELTSLKKQIQDTIKKNEDLKQGISQANSSDYLEEVAREQLNLQKQGEKVVSFILPEQQDKNENNRKNFLNVKVFTGWISNSWNWIKSKF